MAGRKTDKTMIRSYTSKTSPTHSSDIHWDTFLKQKKNYSKYYKKNTMILPAKNSSRAVEGIGMPSRWLNDFYASYESVN